jgi:hypothetical protein
MSNNSMNGPLRTARLGRGHNTMFCKRFFERRGKRRQ